LTQERKRLEDWNKYWPEPETGSAQGQAGWTRADVLTRLRDAPDQLRAEQFRLAPGSPGKGAGEGGRDLGADVDQVGPGAAYERWKRTPEYQQWLKDTGHVRAAGDSARGLR